VAGLGIGLGVWLVGLVAGLGGGLVGALTGGLAVGLAVGLGFLVSQTAFVPFVITRCWQALGRHIPWRLMSFLADAHQKRGVLRQAGAVYQFRHIDLQRRLARRPDS
jgi:predicted lipid-binding transport protein (Tim44 family)